MTDTGQPKHAISSATGRAWDIVIHRGHRTSMAKEKLGFAGTQDEMFTVLLAFWG